VLKPGGLLCFLEHVRADTAGLARIQRALEATVWPHLFGGCHLSRDTTVAIERAGFSVRRLDRFLFPEARTPVSFHITGQAASLPACLIRSAARAITAAAAGASEVVLVRLEMWQAGNYVSALANEPPGSPWSTSARCWTSATAAGRPASMSPA
jgi:hypothetical protein